MANYAVIRAPRTYPSWQAGDIISADLVHSADHDRRRHGADRIRVLMRQHNDYPGCLVFASGLFFVLLGLSAVTQGCGGGQQLSNHAAVTGACISEEQRVVAQATTQEGARERLAPLRAACDALLAVIAAEEPTSGGEAP